MADSSPLVLGAADALIERIRKGDLLPGRGLPSERKLSEELSVSRVVIRAAIRELELRGLISCKARCRPVVNSGIPKQDVDSRPKLRYIAVWIWPSAGDYCAASILRGIQAVWLPPDMKIVVASAVGDDVTSRLESEATFLRGLAADEEAAGAIVWYLGGETNQHALREATDAKVPIVFLDRLPPSSFHADVVGTDNRGAARRAVEYLLSLGHRRIALLSNSEKVSSVLAREHGYRMALRAAQIDLRPEYTLAVSTDEIEGVSEAVDKLLSLPNPPTAIFGINDHVALQAYEALSSRGVSIPEQMSVLGFDGLLRWIPGGGYLSSVWQDFERIGQTAAELVLERIEGPADHGFTHILIDAAVRPSISTCRVPAARPETPRNHSDFTAEVLP